MRELLEIASKFGRSKPVFDASLSSGGQRIVVTRRPESRYEPVPEEGNILEKLVCSNFEEHFNFSTDSFNVNHRDIANRAMRHILSDLTKFLEKNLKMKNPRQSKLWRFFYNNLPETNDFQDNMVLLYKYIRTFSTDEMVLMRGQDQQHVDNTLALMEAIMEKYSE